MRSSHLYNRRRSHYIVEFSNGNYYNSYLFDGGNGAVCYARIFHEALWQDCDEDDAEDGRKISHPLGIISLNVYHNPDWLLDRELTEFVLSEEMFGKAFLDTDLDKGLREGFEMNVNLPYHYLLGAMITLRHTLAHPYFAETWRGCYDICKDKLRALFYADRYIKARIHSDDTYTLCRRNLEYDYCIFPASFRLRDLHLPTLNEDATPSSKYLDLHESTFWAGVWGNGGAATGHFTPSKYFENNPKGYELLIQNEENY